MMGSPKRREIGHGNLARRGIAAVMPDMDDIPVRHPRRLGNSRVERLELDGERVRHQPVADGRGRADQGAGRRRGDGPGARKATASRCSPTSSATKITSATWTSRSPARTDGVTALQMDIKIDGITREIMQVALAQAQRRPPAHPRRDEQGARAAARQDVGVGALDHHDQDRPGEDPRRHRQGWRGHPRDHRRDRHHDRHRERRHGEDRVGDGRCPAAKRSGASS